MTTETEPQDFAAFEAAQNAGEPETPNNAEKPDNPEVNDELELTEDDELIEGEDKPEEGKKPRHKSAKDRIAELTREKHEERRQRVELEQRIAALEGGHKPDPVADIGEAPDPNDEKYEFGEADPQFIRDTIAHGVKSALAEERAKGAEETQKAEASATLATLDESWAEAEARGAEKYDDFTEKLEDFKANAPCPPLLAIAIQASPVGDDATYFLATNQDVAHLIAAELKGGDPLGAARRFGEIEGKFMDKMPKAPSRDAHPIDHALHAGRVKAFVENKGKTGDLKVTKAPEPFKHGVRGAGGRFQKDPADMDFAEFEAHEKRAATR